MARPIKRLQAEPGIIAELWRRSRSTTIGVRHRERAKIILLEGLGAEVIAERLNTTPKPSPSTERRHTTPACLPGRLPAGRGSRFRAGRSRLEDTGATVSQINARKLEKF
jgi:hypothetical protein